MAQLWGHPKIRVSQQPRLCRSWTGLRSRCYSHPAHPPARLLILKTAQRAAITPPHQAPNVPGQPPRGGGNSRPGDPPQGQGLSWARTQKSRPSHGLTPSVLTRRQWRPFTGTGQTGLLGPPALRNHRHKPHGAPTVHCLPGLDCFNLEQSEQNILLTSFCFPPPSSPTNYLKTYF